MNTVYIAFPIGNPELAPIKRLIKKLSYANSDEKIVVLCEKKPKQPIEDVKYEITLNKKRTRYIHIYQKIIGDYLEQVNFSKKYLKNHLKDGDKVIYVNISGLSSFVKTKAKVKNIAFQLELPFTLNPLTPKNSNRQNSLKWTLFYKIVNKVLVKQEKAISEMDWLIVSNLERAEKLEKFFDKKCLIIDNMPFEHEFKNLTKNIHRNRKKMIYNGSISPLRNYQKMIELGENTSNYRIDCFGPFKNKEIGEEFLQKIKTNNVIYGGMKPHDEMMSILSESDFGWGILFYTKKEENHRLCAPLKLYEFLFLGIPIICTTNPPLKRVVEEFNCGLTWDDDETVDHLIKKLDSADYNTLAQNASKAFIEIKKTSEEQLETVVKEILT